MRSKPYGRLALIFLLVVAAHIALGQLAPAATKNEPSLAIGVGFSGFNPDHGHGHLLGGTLSIDYTPSHVPLFLYGIGIEAEARDLNYGRSSNEPGNLREDIASGGVIYSWPHFSNFRPYGKFLMGYGNTDSESKTLLRYHDSRTITCMGGGLEFRAAHRVWVRADYEYQSWPDFFKHTGNTKPAGLLNPQGFTVGASYHFSRPRFH
jgi:opacity protein-like surface antigen